MIEHLRDGNAIDWSGGEPEPVRFTPRITHVAIRFKGEIYSLPAPNRHHDVIRMIVEQTGADTVDGREDDQGFLIDGASYCRRKPALRIALQNGQCKPECLGAKLGKLFSEDVW